MLQDNREAQARERERQARSQEADRIGPDPVRTEREEGDDA